MSVLNRNSESKKTIVLQKGKYVFTEDLKIIENEDFSVPIITAQAIVIIEKEGQISGDICSVNMSDLILKQSSYIDENGKTIEAHKLYTWPRNLGSTPEWTAAKQEFLSQHVLNFPIEVLSVQESNGITWRFITPENFKNFPADIQASPGFKEFAAHLSEYFFLRRPLNTPK